MLATVLAQPLTTAAARVTAWRQVVDLLGQRRAAAGDPAGDRAYDLLRALRDEVPAAIRAEAARALAGHRIPAGLISLFAEEPPAIMAPLLTRARLGDAEWVALLPFFSPVARGILRNRRDLGAPVARGLANFGATDFTLAAPEADGITELEAEADVPPDPTVPAVPGEVQIRELMARIDAFHLPPPADEALPAAIRQEPADRFRFETGPDGTVRWVEGAPRGALVGITLADAAEPLDQGVDGQAAGAYRQRAPFRDARLAVAGAGAAGGEWRISAVPFFDPGDGRFTGYRGTARRPRADQTAAPAAGLHGAGLPPDSLRQLVHELRTPINAVVGFAEMIERQLLGPAGGEYRARAADIIAQGRRLLATVDDLDLSARIESQRLALDPVGVDAALLLGRLHGEYARIARERGVALTLSIATGMPAIDADAAALERMVARLLAATVGLAGRGERIAIALASGDAGVELRVTRPALIAARDERTLLDPGFSPEGDFPDAPVLGLGFALRLVRSLALAARGRLDIAAAEFVLSLPARAETALSGNRRG